MKVFKMVDSRTGKIIAEGDFLKGFYLKEGVTPQEVPVGLFYDFKGNLKVHETADGILTWLKDRTFDEGREDYDDLLRKAGLPKYDFSDIFSLTEGECSYDHIKLI